MKHAVFPLLLTTVLSSSSQAALEPVTLDVANDLLKRGAAQPAFELLSLEIDPASRNPDEWFLLGLSAKGAGRLAEASGAFNKVLELDPNADRVRLELAEVAFRSGDAAGARSLLLAVKAKNPPARVGENIDRFLEVIASAAPKSWRATASLGFMHDSNANAGTSTNSVLMFGLPFTLSPTAMKTSDNALLLRAGLDHAARISDRMAWQSGVALSSTDYRSLNTLDALSVSLSSGPSWQVDERTAFSLPLVGDWLRLGHDQSYYSYSVGVAPQWRRGLSDALALSLTGTYSHKWYQGQSTRNLDAWSVAPSLDWRVGAAGMLSAGLVAAREDSGLDSASNHLAGVNLGYSHAVSDTLRVSIGANYMDTRYQGLEAAFTEIRHDKTARLSLGASYRLAKLGAEASLSVSYTDNDSNLSLYEYDRSQVSVTLGKAF